MSETTVTEVDLYEHGFIRLVDYVGDEIAIVNAARVSFAKEVRGMSDADKGLIKYLLKNHHGTPFEQGFMAQFHIRVPIFVMREWVRHRIGYSINEESGRYTELRNDFFIPEEGREQIGKPGAYTYGAMGEPSKVEWFKGMLRLHSERGFDLYREALEYGFAKEQARLFLGLNLYTEFRWTCNARSLMHFLALRNAPDAMEEIRVYAEWIEKIFAEEMPNVHAAFEEAGRVAP